MRIKRFHLLKSPLSGPGPPFKHITKAGEAPSSVRPLTPSSPGPVGRINAFFLERTYMYIWNWQKSGSLAQFQPKLIIRNFMQIYDYSFYNRVRPKLLRQN